MESSQPQQQHGLANYGYDANDVRLYEDFLLHIEEFKDKDVGIRLPYSDPNRPVIRPTQSSPLRLNDRFGFLHEIYYTIPKGVRVYLLKDRFKMDKLDREQLIRDSAPPPLRSSQIPPPLEPFGSQPLFSQSLSSDDDDEEMLPEVLPPTKKVRTAEPPAVVVSTPAPTLNIAAQPLYDSYSLPPRQQPATQKDEAETEEDEERDWNRCHVCQSWTGGNAQCRWELHDLVAEALLDGDNDASLRVGPERPPLTIQNRSQYANLLRCLNDELKQYMRLDGKFTEQQYERHVAVLAETLKLLKKA